MPIGKSFIDNPVGGGVPVVAVNTTGLTANVGATTLLTTSANGFYRFSCYVVETTAATTSSTLPACNVQWTDADSSFSVPVQQVTNVNTANTVGSYGPTNAPPGNPLQFFAKSGTTIQYSTTIYASTGATAMAYAIHARLEGPF